MYNGKPQRIRALHIGPTGLKSLTGGTYGKITMDNNREGWGVLLGSTGNVRLSTKKSKQL